MQPRLRREGFETSLTPEDVYRQLVEEAVPKGLAALITHNGSEVIPPSERPSINEIPKSEPLNPTEQAAFDAIQANYIQTVSEPSYPTVPSIATIEDPVPSDLDNPLTEVSQHRYADFLGSK